jgi:hypothetical protein
MRRLRAIGEYLGGTEIFFYALLWLMCLLVVGTLAQRYIGLYQAQQHYFSSWWFWVGPMPLPGGYLTMSIITVGLLANFVFRCTWIWERAGTLVTHFGALLLLVGGLLTAATTQEGNMVIPEGGVSNVIADYHRVELAVGEIEAEDSTPAEGFADVRAIATFSEDRLRAGAVLADPVLPFTMHVGAFFRNANVVRRSAPADATHHGFFKMMGLKHVARDKEEERNRSAVQFAVEGAGAVVDGQYAVFESMPIRQTIRVGARRFAVQIRHETTVLPFSLELVDFSKEMHPGTTMARAYASVVLLTDGDITQRTKIHMNHPLRHRGYTFYQASFLEGGEQETTVLAVVKNAGRLFPYISSIIMCIGLLLHLVIQVPRLIQRRRDAACSTREVA